MIKETNSIKSTNAEVLPQLEDPRHPGMHLVSRIALFSLSLFVLLFVLLLISGNSVMLNFDMEGTATFDNNELSISVDANKASVFKTGDQISIHYEGGTSLSARVTDTGTLEKGNLTMTVLVENGGSSVWKEYTGFQDVSLTIKQPLKEFMMSKLSW